MFYIPVIKAKCGTFLPSSFSITKLIGSTICCLIKIYIAEKSFGYDFFGGGGVVANFTFFNLIVFDFV